MIYATTLAAGVLGLWLLWVFYLAVMCLKRARDAGTLTKTAYALGQPVLIIGLLIDTLANFTVVTVMFLEPPLEFLVTSRLKRHIERDRGWRSRLARWCCSTLLDSFDPSGSHCR
jgi:hypothetical protein